MEKSQIRVNVLGAMGFCCMGYSLVDASSQWSTLTYALDKSTTTMGAVSCTSIYPTILSSPRVLSLDQSCLKSGPPGLDVWALVIPVSALQLL